MLRIKIPAGLSTDFELEDLVRELGCLPLAITQAGAYISARVTRITIFEYPTLYHQGEVNQSRLLDEEPGDLKSDTGVPDSVIRTWRISFDRIKKTCPRSAELLSLTVVLDHRGIPESSLSATDQKPLDFEDGSSPLNEFSLVVIKKGAEALRYTDSCSSQRWNWLRRALAGRETMAGPEHPDIVISTTSLALALYYQGQVSGG